MYTRTLTSIQIGKQAAGRHNTTVVASPPATLRSSSSRSFILPPRDAVVSLEWCLCQKHKKTTHHSYSLFDTIHWRINQIKYDFRPIKRNKLNPNTITSKGNTKTSIAIVRLTPFLHPDCLHRVEDCDMAKVNCMNVPHTHETWCYIRLLWNRSCLHRRLKSKTKIVFRVLRKIALLFKSDISRRRDVNTAYYS